jgi:hypothetical protein
VGEVDLRLSAGRGFEPALEDGRLARAHAAQEVLHRGVAAAVAEVADLAEQAAAGQVRVGSDPLAQVPLERADPRRPGRARAVDRRLQAALDVFAHRLAVEPRAPGDGGDG